MTDEHGDATIIGSRIMRNTASEGGGIYHDGDDGRSQLTLTKTKVSQNDPDDITRETCDPF